jgi:hypothetical protein
MQGKTEKNEQKRGECHEMSFLRGGLFAFGIAWKTLRCFLGLGFIPLSPRVDKARGK